MLSNPIRLIDQSIESLQSLTAHLENDVAMTHVRAAALKAEERAAKEALILIDMLIPKLQLVRQGQIVSSRPSRAIG